MGAVRMNMLQCLLQPLRFDFWLVHKSCAYGAIKAVANHTWLNVKVHSIFLLSLCADAKVASACSTRRGKK